MSVIRRAGVVCLVAASLMSPLMVWAQPAPPPAPGPSVDPFEDLRRSPDWELRPYRRLPSDIRVGQTYQLGAGREIADVLVVAGNATIEGRATRDVVVVFGDVELGSQAVIGGTLTVIGGNLTVREGAQLERDLVVIGGTLDAPSSFVTRGDHFVLDPNAFGGWMKAGIDWVSRGLLWGRLIVPGLPWMWPILGLILVLSLAMSLLLERPIASATDTLGERPLTASLVGLLILLLAGPVCVLLAVSVVGIAVVPFVICALLLALVVGKLAVARRIGRGIVAESDPAARAEAIRSFVVGFAVLAIAYMVPVLGLVTWTLTGVFGIGASALAFMAAYRRENPVVPVIPKVAPIPAAVPPMSYAVPAFAERPLDSSDSFDPSARQAEPLPGVPPPVVPPPYGSLLAFPKASFRDRVAAGVLDAILVVFVSAVFDDFLRDNAMPLIALAYFIGFWAWKGTTVGGIILQLRVVRTDGAPLAFAEALVRGLSSVFSAIVLGLGFLWILKDPERQAWQDKIAGTYVVKVPRNWPL